MSENLKSENTVCFDSQEFVSIEEAFPFRTSVSLEPLRPFWNNLKQSENGQIAGFATKVLDEWDKSIISETLDSGNDFVQDKNLLFSLLSPFMPSAYSANFLISANKPFSLKTVLSTSLFREKFGEEINDLKGQVILNVEEMKFSKIVNAIKLILHNCYNIESGSFSTITVGIKGQNDLLTYYQMNFDTQFVKVNYTGTLEPVDKDILKKLLTNKEEFSRWKEIFPPHKFSFTGIYFLHAVDITEENILSLLKYDLLEKDSFVSTDKFYELRNKLRSYFRLPGLRLGLAAFNHTMMQNFDYARKIGNSFILNDSCAINCNNFEGSIYDVATSTGEIQIVEDILQSDTSTIVEREILKLDIRNLAVIPLYEKGKLIGFLELGSANPGEINHLNKHKIYPLIPLFSTAVKRSLDEYDAEIQSIIKQECTAINPTVEWRFREAAIKKINNADSSLPLEPIVFKNLYPLYALCDIRNSSNYRVESIKSDLLEHLRLISVLLQKFQKKTRLPYLSELLYQVDELSRKTTEGLSSGDEVEIIEFITRELEPVFIHLKQRYPEFDKDVDMYVSKLDPGLKIYYKKRKDFEQSVAILNETISSYITYAEGFAQKIFPFFSEKYKTDGVEHSIYIGESLVEDKVFNEIYLKNLRLWQLVLMCGIVKKVDNLKPSMKMPLETAQLVLVQNSPLSIRFRYDEKKFDVDGTYNIRYEIMKKRIDKAIVNGSKERLTQPGKIAIVYSQNKEAYEYKRYLDFLRSKKMLKGDIEYLELEELQGVRGLKAIRFIVDTENINPDELAQSRYTLC